MSGPKLYVVATPIGNLSDISPRAREILSQAAIIAAEDTRHTGMLLKKLNIKPHKLISYHDHNEKSQAKRLIDILNQDACTMALVSDAGTPCISDPGYNLVAMAHQAGIPVHPIPGPSALTALVSAAGLANHRVLFIGFLPTAAKALEAELHSWDRHQGCIVFYESARRLEKTLQSIKTIYPDSIICIGRELTKLHEEIFRGTIEDALDWLADHTVIRGEIAVALSLEQKSPAFSLEGLEATLRQELLRGRSFKDITADYQDSGITKSDLYKKLILIKQSITEEQEDAHDSNT